MKYQKSILSFLFAFFIFFTTISISGQQEESGRKIHSVIVMPFYIDEPYPFHLDLIRESLVLGLYQKGFNVIMDDSSWSRVFEFDYPFYNLSDDMADSISTALDIDLVVFGRIDYYSAKYRPGGFFTPQFTPNPILVKVYDARNKKLALFERIDFVQRWGLFVNNLSLNDFGLQIANQLSERGY